VSSEHAAPERKPLVLDANILVRAVLGRRVLPLLETYSNRVAFLAPAVAFADARAHLPEILRRRGVPTESTAQLLEDALGRLLLLVTEVPPEAYSALEAEARRRLAQRDQSDWPFLALALQLGCPIWTEDQDFFGSGVPTWTTDRVAIYLET
jgi:predicted nucleic acid-binding protein